MHRALLILCFFVGVGALGGGITAYISPETMGASSIIPLLQEIPSVGPYINSYIIPASALLLFVFVPQAIATVLLLRKHSRQFIGAIVSGAFLAVFTIVELIFVYNYLSWLYLAFGVIEIVTAIVCARTKRQSGTL